jgi:predicted RNA-binding Zn-ribbon protein involved in translation (DUF1610 family)
MAIIKCPECGHDVSSRAPVCPNCGAAISGRIVKCRQCGKVFFKDERQCPNCGCPSENVLSVEDDNLENKKVIQESENQQVSYGNQPSDVSSKKTNDAVQLQSVNTTGDVKKGKGKRNVIIVSLVIILLIVGGGLYFHSYESKNAERNAWNTAMNSEDQGVLQSYLDEFKDAPEAHRDSIEAHLNILKQADIDWTNVLVSNSRDAFQEYLESHANTPHKAEAEHKIDSLDWVLAKSLNTIDAFQTYKDSHPSGEYTDDADEQMKVINSKTVQPEEKRMISAIMNEFFSSINANDENGLKSTVADVLSSFLGKSSATKNDVETFLHKIYKADIESMNWSIPGDLKISKKEIGDNKYEYTVTFQAVENVNHINSTSSSQQYRIKAKVDPNEKITEFNMDKINY